MLARMLACHWVYTYYRLSVYHTPVLHIEAAALIEPAFAYGLIVYTVHRDFTKIAFL